MNKNQQVLQSVRSSKQDAPCVSIYINKPNERLLATVPSIELFRELSYARSLLESSMSREGAANYVKPILKLAKKEFLKEGRGSLGFFLSGNHAHCVRLSEVVPTETVVATDFHIKPLLKRQAPQEFGNLDWGVTLCRRAIEEGRALTELFQVAQALKSGQAHCLWVAEDVSIWGVLNRKQGSVVLHPGQMNDRDGDILDDLLEWAIDLGIEAHVLPQHQIPGQHPVIAEV